MKGILALTVGVNVAVLAVFKYAGFFVQTLNDLTGLGWAVPQLALPIGISFYTFQSLSYLADVYRGEVRAQKSFWKFLLYLSLFPQLIAGPIVRYSDIEAQLAERSVTAESLFYGALRFCVGLGKKVLIANYAGKAASALLDGGAMTVTGTWFGILMFAFEIYFDFSGYSDMAIGLGRIFGFRYPENFNLPYVADSLTDFWRRWHISLSSFFRDYVYIPMGGNRKHQVWNLLVVWVLTGLWHGASWNFVLWGLYFFLFLYLEKLCRPALEKIPRILRHLGTILLLLLGWTVFYYTDLTRMGEAFSALFGGAELHSAAAGITMLNALPLLAVCVLGSTPLPRRAGLILSGFCVDGSDRLTWQRGCYAGAVFLFDLAILALSTISLVGSSYNPFLYFRF